MNKLNTTLRTWVLAVALTTTGFVGAKTATYQLPAVDVLAAKSTTQAGPQQPLKYALNTPIKDLHYSSKQQAGGQWTQMFDGRWEFRLRLAAENATSLNVGMADFYLPPTAALWVHNDDESISRGPYDSSYNKNHGYFWTGDVPGDHLNLLITVSDRDKRHLSFAVHNVTRGFYRYWESALLPNKSGSCHVDVACPEAEAWSSQVSSVGFFAFVDPFSGGELCTGQLINNTAEDATPYFLTGSHCGFSFDDLTSYTTEQKQSTAASMNVIWNYQSLMCRLPGSAQSGTPISTSGFNERQAGATFVANNPLSDFALVALNELPDSSYGVEYTGWDRRDVAPDSVFGIHHPQGHAKRFSLENDATSISGYLEDTGVGGDAYIRVEDWDLGTTESGSSGSGIWNAEGLLVGQLHGGDAACGNDLPDWYGRFFTSWDTGSEPDTRLRDWLDPDDTGSETLSSYGGCLAPSVAISQNSGDAVGDSIEFTAQASGGTGGYTYQWDLGADGTIDGTEDAFQVRFSQPFVGNIKLLVRDSSGCGRSTSQALVVEGPDIQLQDVVNIRENLDQVCGNNNSVIDPGERWSTLLMAQNQGDHPATEAYLALGKQRSTDEELPSDDHGNTWDNCARSFIDISTTGTVLEWEAANDDFPADDDGSTLIQLTQSFDHYGQSIDQLRASSNGYFSTASNSNGADWDNDCPLPTVPNQDAVGARIYPLHDDLKDSVFYHQYFDQCPRLADDGVAQPCEVFLWQGADLFSTTNTTENIDIQAILYPETAQWVFQYAGDLIDGEAASVGMQNAAGSDGLTVACNQTGLVNATDAYCVYNRDFQPAANGNDFLVIESPTISLGDLAVNENRSRPLHFAVTEDAQCGSEIGIDYQAAVYDQGHNAGEDNIFSQVIGHHGQCSVVTSCGVGDSSSVVSNDITPRRGLWWNPSRGGNGFDWYTIEQNSLVYLFYTGDANGEPVWYLANDADAKHNQYFNHITRYQAPDGFGQGPLTFAVVGWSNTSFIDATHAIQVRQINGHMSAEKLEFFQYGADATPNLHTGLFFTPSEGGWGQSVGTLGDARVVINYLYTDAGQPYWTIASGPNDSNPMDAYYFNTFCPSCPAVGAPGRIVGTISLSLNGQVDGTLNQFNVTDEGVNWSRSNLPVINLIPPEDD